MPFKLSSFAPRERFNKNICLVPILKTELALKKTVLF
jgi:hypothetical protein